MEITELQEYKKLEEIFEEKGYSLGNKNKMPIYSWKDDRRTHTDLTPGHFVDAIAYGKIKFKDIPEKYLTRGFFLHTLSGVHEDVIEYVKANPSMFDKQFFKDHIATNYYGLEFELNDFEYMPLEFIDEEMVMCAMFRAINMRYADRRWDCKAWFFSVYRRKPEVLTQELYTLGARCFASKIRGENKFLSITPKKYRTPEFYFALCLQNDSKVMEDIPKSILTTSFLVRLLNDSTKNIRCFSENALERELPMVGRGIVKSWQAVLIIDGYRISDIPLNEERVKFFLSMYDKDSYEYENAFKDHYKSYIRKKNVIQKTKINATELVGARMALVGIMSGKDIESAIRTGTVFMNTATDHQSMIPIHYKHKVPMEYSKKYDREEYLLEIYKKIGINVGQEIDSNYYSAILPENVFIVQDEYGYSIKDSNENVLLHYYDRGPFYDRTVTVDKVNVTL